LKLQAEGLSFELHYLKPDEEGWVGCNVIINVPGFRGDVDFHMLRSDLERFHTELSSARVATNWPREVLLASTEPGFELSFRVERTGQVAGQYRFGSQEIHRAVLSGDFTMDQTYLEPLLSQTEQVLADFS